MNRNGVVTEVKGERAVVQLLRHTACGECGACQLGDDSKQIRIECANEVGAQVGEFVEIDLESPNVLGAAFIMYMIPLVALLVGVLGGTLIFGALTSASIMNPEWIKYKELVGSALGVALMTLTYFVIKGKEDKFSDSQKYLSRITKVDRTELQI
ncbi:SoxR reducing system RseC family protein [Fusibacter sp. JL216-2]|uniref:SoxR reducing system RseC family protein n=1 Tax=Fusibacter sp. JL216-2 TaxID=3071453 RepID=UPI003D350CCD